MEKLRKEIEAARRNLDDAVGRGCNDQLCHTLSEELDRLIEIYIDMKERECIPIA